MIRTLYQLSEELDNSLAWRKRELSNLKLLESASKRDFERATVRRAGLPLIYAHWEGFVKEAATAYLEFISRQGLKCREVQTSILALACRDAIKESAASDRPHIHSQLIDYLLLNQQDPLRIPYKGVVNTRSNLNSEVLRDIHWMIGVPYLSDFQTKELLIDGSLLAKRNAVAHGRGDPVDEDTFRELHALVVELLNLFRNAVENAASSALYRRS